MRLSEKKARFFIFQLFLIYTFSYAEFDPSRFNFGTDWNFLSKNKSSSVATAVDYVTIWLNDPSFNIYWHGEMLKFCRDNNKTPVFYAYIIAKTSGLGDANMGGRLDSDGGGWLRNNFNKVKSIYEDYATQTANIYGTTNPVIWLMEPDFSQYCDNDGNDLSINEAKDYMNQLINTVLNKLPNAIFAFDISPWLPNFNQYVSSFDMSKFTFMFTSGGETYGNSPKIRDKDIVTWQQAYDVAKKCIIADCGYGVGGQSQGHITSWDDINNIKNRINDGVVAITQANPRTDWGNTINSLKSSLSGIKTKCSGIVFKKSYTLTVKVEGNGKVTINPEKTSY